MLMLRQVLFQPDIDCTRQYQVEKVLVGGDYAVSRVKWKEGLNDNWRG
ncbi:MAG: hypothetical protein MRK00_15140 [Nitrosomonas sp.]|nr:hypothetical protein [Nitrosomonas sp.]